MPFQKTILVPSTTNWVAAGGTDVSAAPVVPQVNLENAASAIFSAVVTKTTPGAQAAAAASWATSDIITLPSHGFFTGLKGQVTTTTTLPTGISAVTDYFVRVLSSNTISLYNTYANAVATGSTTGLIDITNIGAGTHTFTPTALAGGVVKLQGSLDGGATWLDIPGETKTITTTTSETFVWEIDYIRYPDYRLLPSITAGSITVAGVCTARN